MVVSTNLGYQCLGSVPSNKMWEIIPQTATITKKIEQNTLRIKRKVAFLTLTKGSNRRVIIDWYQKYRVPIPKAVNAPT